LVITVGVPLLTEKRFIPVKATGQVGNVEVSTP